MASVAAPLGPCRCGSRALEHRLSRCGSPAYLFFNVWDLPRSQMEPKSPALAGRFFSTEPPGKSSTC